MILTEQRRRLNLRRILTGGHHLSLRAVVLKHLLRLISEPSPLSSLHGVAQVSANCGPARAFLPTTALQVWTEVPSKWGIVSLVQFIKDLPSFISRVELPVPWPLVPSVKWSWEFSAEGEWEDRRQKEGEFNVCSLHCSSPDWTDISGFIITTFLCSDNLKAYELESRLRE